MKSKQLAGTARRDMKGVGGGRGAEGKELRGTNERQRKGTDSEAGT